MALLWPLACAPQPERDPAPGPGDIAEGRTLYLTNGCATCHGTEGRGDGAIAHTLVPRPRDFRQPGAFKRPRTVTAIADVIAEGIPSTPTPMPAYVHLDRTSRRQMAAFILSLGSVAQVSTPPEAP